MWSTDIKKADIFIDSFPLYTTGVSLSRVQLCDSGDYSPPGSPVPGILQARTLELVAISLSNAWKWSRSVVSDSSQPHGLRPTRLLCPWDFPGKSTPSPQDIEIINFIGFTALHDSNLGY